MLTFTEEILNGKLYFLCSASGGSSLYQLMSTYQKENLKGKLCCVDCTRTMTRCMALHASDQGFPSKGGGFPPQWRWMGNFAWEINLYDGGHLGRSDFDHLSFFQGQTQHSVNIEH